MSGESAVRCFSMVQALKVTKAEEETQLIYIYIYIIHIICMIFMYIPWEPTTFIFRGYNPYIGGSKLSFFMVLGSKSMHIYVLRIAYVNICIVHVYIIVLNENSTDVERK